MERVRTCQLNGHSRSLSFSAIIIVTIIMMVVMIMIVAPCCQSVNDSANSTFLQKGQLCQLKTAEKLRFCIHFSQNKMQNCYLFCLCLSFKLKVKKRYLFLKKKSCIFSFRVDDILTSILSALHPFLTFPNDLLKHKRGIFFCFQAIS